MSRKRLTKEAKNTEIDAEERVILKKEVRARTPNQQKLIDCINSNTITFSEGKPGSGKTHISVGMAIDYLRRGRVKKIVVSRPVVQAGEDIGALPGDTLSKLNPFIMPLYDEMLYFISKSELQGWLNSGILEICPLAYMRGRTFNNSFIILDEAQNASHEQLKMFLTRIGRDSIIVVNGDSSQSDLPRFKTGALDFYMDILYGVQGVGLVKLELCDIVRNPIIQKILDREEEYYDKEKGSST
jgi:phosphate starvation-inducible protein PhoH and related proteins